MDELELLLVAAGIEFERHGSELYIKHGRGYFVVWYSDFTNRWHFAGENIGSFKVIPNTPVQVFRAVVRVLHG